MSTPLIRFTGEPVSVTIDHKTVVELPPRVFRARLVGMLFETNKTFLLPSAMHGVRGLRRYYDQHPGLSVLVTGHTDTAGSTAYNQGLSDERATTVAAYLTEHVVPCLIGRDAHRIEDIWQFLYKGAYWRRGPVTMSAIAARKRAATIVPTAASARSPTNSTPMTRQTASALATHA